MANRVTGMYSGMDTESLIQDLMKAKRKKVESMNKNKTKMEWKQEIWNDLNKKIKTFYSKTVGNMKWTTSYSKKATSVSDSSAVSVITGDKAMNSVQNLSILNLASSGYLTGAKVSANDGSEVKGSTLVSDLAFVDSEGNATQLFSGTGSFNVNTNGKTTKIEINSDTTIDSVVAQLNTAGVSANFDAKNGRLFIGAKESGKASDFTITANDAGGNAAMSVLGINAAPSEQTNEAYAKLAAYSGKSLDDIISSDASDYARRTVIDRAKKYLEADISAKSSTIDKIKGLNKEIEDLNAQLENETLTDTDKAAIQEKIDAKNEELTTLKDGKELETLETELSDLKSSLAAEDYTSVMDKAYADFSAQVSFATSFNSSEYAYYNTGEDGAKKLDGDDAVIELNGVKFTSNSNNVEVNGLTFTCKAVASNITVTTQDDTDGIYDMIKDFVKEYNTLINEIDSLYNAESTKLEPLTDEEKDYISDTEAEKLEKKVKDSLLRRDDSLEKVFNGLKDVMAGGIEIGGETLYLTNFGIETMSYLLAPEGQRNALHIDGDPDDETSAGNADKLKTMIANDPSTVIDFFSQLGKNLDQKLAELSKGDDYTTFGSFFNDKQMKTDMSDYEKKIAETEEKLQDEEDKLYDKFSAMEVALSKIDSKNSYISQLFSM